MKGRGKIEKRNWIKIKIWMKNWKEKMCRKKKVRSDICLSLFSLILKKGIFTGFFFLCTLFNIASSAAP
jgi:hypothetical protein